MKNKKETKFKCPKCKGEITPTDDFFIWKCKQCGMKLIIQVGY